jgi:hypothetical protein
VFQQQQQVIQNQDMIIAVQQQIMNQVKMYQFQMQMKLMVMKIHNRHDQEFEQIFNHHQEKIFHQLKQPVELVH